MIWQKHTCLRASWGAFSPLWLVARFFAVFANRRCAVCGNICRQFSLVVLFRCSGALCVCFLLLYCARVARSLSPWRVCVCGRVPVLPPLRGKWSRNEAAECRNAPCIHATATWKRQDSARHCRITRRMTTDGFCSQEEKAERERERGREREFFNPERQRHFQQSFIRIHSYSPSLHVPSGNYSYKQSAETLFLLLFRCALYLTS